MTEQTVADAREAFESHEAFEQIDDGFRVETTVFDATATAAETDGWKLRYEVSVTVPTLSAAVAGDAVGSAVESGWLDTFERRLEDAPTSTRASVDLSAFAVESDDETIDVIFAYEFGDPERAVEIAKTFVEYVEGTYVEGIVPGYEYESPVADLVRNAQQGEGGAGGTPL
jgi:hypothetical protein